MDHAPPSPQLRGRWPWAAVAVLTLITTAVIFYPRERSLESVPLQLQLNPPLGREFRPQDIALSPDGKHLAFVTGGSVSKLWVRALDSLTARELRDTNTEPRCPLVSADQHALGFFAGGKVKRIDLENERIVTLADAPAGEDPGTQTTSSCSQRQRMVRSGGSLTGAYPVAATTLDTEASHRFPAFLPDGRHFLFYARAVDPEVRGIYWASLDNPRLKQRVVDAMFAGIYAPPGGGQPGRLLWRTSKGGLIAQTFNGASGRVSGEAVLVPNMGLLQQLGYDQVTQPCRFPATERWCTARAKFGISWPGMTAREGLRARFELATYTGVGLRADALHIPRMENALPWSWLEKETNLRICGRSMLPAATSRESQLMEPGPGALRGRRTDGRSPI